MDKQQLILLANTKMPFGKYQGKLLIHLPERYLIWINNHVDVTGQLQQQLQLTAEIKLNGLEHLIVPLIANPVNY